MRLLRQCFERFFRFVESRENVDRLIKRLGNISVAAGLIAIIALAIAIIRK